MSAAPILAVLVGLPKATHVNGNWRARCPNGGAHAHDDRNPSLAWKVLEDGKVLLRCWVCRTEDVIAALGMSMRDVFPVTNGHAGAVRPYEPMTRDRYGEWSFQSDRDAAQVKSVASKVLSWADLMAEPLEPPPTIRPGIPEVGVTILAGAPKAGKTLWASQMAMESRRPVLLVIEEGALAAIAYRLRRQASGLGIERPPITLMHRQHVRLDDPASVARLVAHVAETEPALIVFDPLNRLHSADENRPAAMTPVMDALAELAYEDGGRAVVAVHHVNKPSADRRGDIWDRLRGASSIRSGTDANLILDGDKGAYRKLVGEFRDAEPLVEHIELDRDALLFRAADAPEAPAKVDPLALRLFVEERGQVTSRQVVEQFGVARNTAIYALRALGCDEYEGARRQLTFTLRTGQ